MTSNDMNSYIREDVFNARMDRLEAINERNIAVIDTKFAEVNSQFSEVKAEIRVLSSRIDNIENRFDDVRNFMSIGFCIIAILIALIPYFNHRKERRADEKNEHSFVTAEQVQHIVDEAVSSALGKIGR